MWKKSNLKQFSVRQKQQNVKKMNEYICKALYIHIYIHIINLPPSRMFLK